MIWEHLQVCSHFWAKLSSSLYISNVQLWWRSAGREEGGKSLSLSPPSPHQCSSTFRYLPLPLFVCHDLLYTWAWTISGYLSVCSDLTSFPWQAPRTHAVPCEMKQVGKHPAAPSVGDCYLCFISLFPLSFTTALFALFPMFLSLKGEKNYLLLISNGL